MGEGRGWKVHGSLKEAQSSDFSANIKERSWELTWRDVITLADDTDLGQRESCGC